MTTVSATGDPESEPGAFGQVIGNSIVLFKDNIEAAVEEYEFDPSIFCGKSQCMKNITRSSALRGWCGKRLMKKLRHNKRTLNGMLEFLTKDHH